MKEELDELLSHCIRCGFCLEACPTFQETGSEMESPRGRIYLVRSATEGKLGWSEDVKPHLDLCLGCRACEPACPSGVQYGEILEAARTRIEGERPQFSKKMLLESTTRPAVLKTQLALAGLMPGSRMPRLVSRLLSGVDPEADLPSPQKPSHLPPLDEDLLPPIVGEVYFLEGCAMSVLFNRVNACSKRLLRRAGYQVREVPQGCCGALHAHNGYLPEAISLAEKLMQVFADDLPIVVNSAGCGSTMKDYRKMMPDNPRSAAFADRVFDLSEFLSAKEFAKRLLGSNGAETKVAYHEACHLVHGQRISQAPKDLLRAVPKAHMVYLEEADLCCGSAGIYNITEPEMARRLLDRKWSNVVKSGAEVVVTGNPGCHSWIAQASREHGASVPVLHTAEFLEASFIGLGHILPPR